MRAIAAAASIGFVLVAAALVHPDHLVVGSLFVLTLGWAALPPTFDALTTTRRHRTAVAPREATVTSIIRLGDEPLDIARTSIVLTAAAGPTVVATTAQREALEDLDSIGVRVCIASTIEAAVHDAAQLVDTDAVLVHSASAFPQMAACRAAAGQLDDHIGWIVGSTSAFNDDGYAPEGRELLASRLRRRARSAGLDVWERDAVIVRSDLLRTRPIEAGRPWGAWLRRLRSEGFANRDHSAPFTTHASPAGADAFWSPAILRKRAAAADLADAATTGPTRARVAATGLLLRELHAYPLMVWLLAPLLIDWTGAFPFRCSAQVFFAVAGGLALLRWVVARIAGSVVLRPAQDALAVAFDIPGSLLALPAAVTRRVRPTRVRVPERPLVWAALLLTLLLALPLIDDSADAPTSQVAVAFALANLLLLWAFAMRALLQRSWLRSTYRFPLRLPVTVDGIDATTRDGSPAGLAVLGSFDGFEIGRVTKVVVTLSDGSTLEVVGKVIDRRHRGEHDVLGFSLEMGADQRARWLPELFRTDARRARSEEPARGPRVERELAGGHGARLLRIVERAVIGLVAMTSVLVFAVLLLVFLGYRPLVVRSGSMVPALGVGDVAIVEDVPADSVRVGDVVTFDDPLGRGDTVTHRVRAIEVVDGVLQFETRGDANDESEYWSASASRVIGRYSWRIPTVGRGLVALSSPAARWGLGIGVVALLAAAVVLSRIHQLRPRLARVAA